MTTDLTVPGNGESDFPLLRTEIDPDLREAQENIGANGIAVADLPRIKVPSGGGTNFTMQTLDGDQTPREIECLILAWKQVRG
jgi:hypothetical protein